MSAVNRSRASVDQQGALSLSVLHGSRQRLANLKKCLADNQFLLHVRGADLVFQPPAAGRISRCLKSLQVCQASALVALPGWRELQVLLIQITLAQADTTGRRGYSLQIVLKEAQSLALHGGQREALGLSESEAALALALAQGVSLDAYAQRQSLSKNTVRTQASIIRRKTGAKTQTQIASLVWLLCQDHLAATASGTRVVADNLLVAGD